MVLQGQLCDGIVLRYRLEQSGCPVRLDIVAAQVKAYKGFLLPEVLTQEYDSLASKAIHR